MCISAIDFLGDAMNCKGSVLSGIDCNDSSWCDSRDEVVVESKSATKRACEEELSVRYGDLLDTQSLSSSVHHLLHDSSQRLSKQTMTRSRLSDDDIFRSRESPKEEPSNRCLPFNKLNRCTAWVQEDYTIESERPIVESKSEPGVSIVHWEDRLNDSDHVDVKNGCGIFRPNFILGPGSIYSGSFKLHRSAAWSLDDSSLVLESEASSVRRNDIVISKKAEIVHWDELVQDSIE